MYFKLKSFFSIKPTHTILYRFKCKYMFTMNKAYLKHTSDESDQFEISFKYVDKTLNVDRQFNFCRKLSENVDSFLSRVVTNVEKVLNKKRKRKIEAENDAKLNKIALLLNNEEVSKEVRCGEIFRPGNHVVLYLQETSYDVIIDSPWVNLISLPNSILAGFPVYPNKFDAVFTDKLLSEFIWFKSRDKNKWTVVGEQYIYTACNEDIDHYLKLRCIPRNENDEGPSIETTSICKVEANPGECPFEHRQKFTIEKTKGKEFRVVSYNILAELYSDTDYAKDVLFSYCPKYALAIDYRKNLIMKEIIGYNADLICLQEVDKKVFKHDLQPTLSHLGYDGNFFNKGIVTEGLAFFCNKDRFRILESHRLVFAEHISKDPLYADIWEKIAQNSKLAERILERTTTLAVNVVESIEHDEVSIVANIHLYFHPDADHIRLLHGGLAIRYLENLHRELQKKITGKRISLIFCGDFNSVPECGIYELFNTGTVSKDCIDYQSNKEESVDNVELKQSFNLGSACGTPPFTNYAGCFQACLDYIYYDKRNLDVTQVVPFPSQEEVTQNTALPSVVFPSDHIALIADLKWI